MTPENIYRNGDVFYRNNEDGTETVVPSDHEHHYVPADPTNLDSAQVCYRCTMPATQNV